MNYLNPGDNRWEKWNLNVDDTNFELDGAPGRTRTSNLLIRSPIVTSYESLLPIAIKYYGVSISNGSHLKSIVTIYY